MTTPEHESPQSQPHESPQTDGAHQDRVHRSPAGIASGVLLLVIGGWLGVDAIISGHGRAPWLALAALLLVVPLVVAFTLRPAVYASDERLRLRNPFRVIVLPWGEVADLRSSYSNEVLTAGGKKYQIWAVPVSLRGRKKAARRAARAAAAGEPLGGGRGGMGLGGWRAPGERDLDGRAGGDVVMADLRGLFEQRRGEKGAQGEVTVRWAWEVLGPAVAGGVVLGILLGVG